MRLPRVYWCHLDHRGAARLEAGLQGFTASTPGPAVDWMRESARDLSPALDRDAFARMWAWLGDHRAVDAGVKGLRQGASYEFTVTTDTGVWTWTVHRVSVLPLVDRCISWRESVGKLSVARSPIRALHSLDPFPNPFPSHQPQVKTAAWPTGSTAPPFPVMTTG